MLVCMAPLTTPEEAKTFLATMREAQQKRERLHQPPSNLNADGMDAWFLRQRKEEQEMRNRRREAETILRNYRGGNNNGAAGSGAAGRSSLDSQKSGGSTTATVTTTTPRHSSARSEHGSDMPADPNDTTTTHYPPNAPSPSASSLASSRRVDRGSGGRTSLPAGSTDNEAAEEKKDNCEPPSPNHCLSSKQREMTTPYFGRTPRNAQVDYALDQGGGNGAAAAASTGGIGAQLLASPTPPPEQPQVEETIWRDFVSKAPGAKFPPEPGRYHLYCSYACPGSHRALIVRVLKGLEGVIGVTSLHPVWRLTKPHDSMDKHRGWVFGNPGGDPFSNTIHKGGPFPAAYSDNEPDPHNALPNGRPPFSVRDLYELANDTSGKYTVPLLWDTHLQTIVNNESSDIAYMFNSSFNSLATHPELDLYTEDDVAEKAKLSQVSDWLSPLMIHGVYRCGFAKTQWAYDRAINDLCAAFDRADDILERQRYLTGNDALTDVDIRLFVTLLRFDEVYNIYFKANARLVLLTPSLLNFCRDIYQMPGVAATCNMEQIKAHFFASHAEWNKYSVIPRGLGFMELLDMPHDRAKLSTMTTMSHPLFLLPPSSEHVPSSSYQQGGFPTLPPSTTHDRTDSSLSAGDNGHPLTSTGGVPTGGNAP